MSPLMAFHIAAGAASLLCGGLALGARKGGGLHRRAGSGFAASMILMGLSAALLVSVRGGADRAPPAGSILVCYLVATGWWTARNRAGTAGKFEILACASAAAIAAVAFVTAAVAPDAGPAGTVVFTGGLATLAAALDLSFIIRGRLTGAQRIRRHLWRMCVAFFFATGAFFLGQQDVMPAAMRGSPWLFAPAFAPLAAMLFWMARRPSPRSGSPAKTSGGASVRA